MLGLPRDWEGRGTEKVSASVTEHAGRVAVPSRGGLALCTCFSQHPQGWVVTQPLGQDERGTWLHTHRDPSFTPETHVMGSLCLLSDLQCFKRGRRHFRMG